RMGLTRLVNQLVSEGSVIAIRVLDKNMITVEYSERMQDIKLPELTENDVANLRKLASEGRTESHLEGSLLKVAAPIGEGGGRVKRWGDPGDSSYRSHAGRYSQRGSVGNSC